MNPEQRLRADLKLIVGKAPKDLSGVLSATSLHQAERALAKAYHPMIHLSREELGKARSAFLRIGIGKAAVTEEVAEGTCKGHRCKNPAGADRLFCSEKHEAFEQNHRKFRDAFKAEPIAAMPGMEPPEVPRPPDLSQAQEGIFRDILHSVLKRYGVFAISPSTLDGLVEEMIASSAHSGFDPKAMAALIARDPARLGLGHEDVDEVVNAIIGQMKGVKKDFSPGKNEATFLASQAKPTSAAALDVGRLIAENPAHGHDSGWTEDVDSGLVLPGTAAKPATHRGAPLMEKGDNNCPSCGDKRYGSYWDIRPRSSGNRSCWNCAHVPGDPVEPKDNDSDIEQWIANDEGLYNWHQSTGLDVNDFIDRNRDELKSHIEGVKFGNTPAHFLAYGTQTQPALYASKPKLPFNKSFTTPE